MKVCFTNVEVDKQYGAGEDARQPYKIKLMVEQPPKIYEGNPLGEQC
jgi:hypothetical protein